MPDSPPPPPPPLPQAPPPKPKPTHFLRYGCLAVLALILLVVATVAITLWWIQRPIKPVVLSPQEKATVDRKISYLENPDYTASAPPRSAAPPSLAAPLVATNSRTPAPYVPGSKVLRLSDREINGLLNANTDLGKSVRVEFDKDAVNAYVAVRIPQDFPVGGGRMFRARARFRLTLDAAGEPFASLDDVTVLGISLPNAWLGGIKGQNLIGQAVGERNGKPALRGIKNLHVEPGSLVLELAD